MLSLQRSVRDVAVRLDFLADWLSLSRRRLHSRPLARHLPRGMAITVRRCLYASPRSSTTKIAADPLPLLR